MIADNRLSQHLDFISIASYLSRTRFQILEEMESCGVVPFVHCVRLVPAPGLCSQLREVVLRWLSIIGLANESLSH